jgi:hypothetical protein
MPTCTAQVFEPNFSAHHALNFSAHHALNFSDQSWGKQMLTCTAQVFEPNFSAHHALAKQMINRFTVLAAKRAKIIRAESMPDATICCPASPKQAQPDKKPALVMLLLSIALS